MTKLWLATRYLGYDPVYCDTGIIGIFSSEELAIKACTSPDDNVGPIILDEVDDPMRPWLDSYNPLDTEE